MDFDEFQATLSDVLQNETTQDALLGLGAASAAALTMGAASRVFGVARAPEEALSIAHNAYAHLEIVQVDADNILAADSNGLSDPYFKFRIVRGTFSSPPPVTEDPACSKSRRTEVIEEKRTDLHWNAPGIEFDIRRHDVFNYWLYAELFDHDATFDDFLGEAFFPLRAIFLAGANTSVQGSCASPPSFTLPLTMPSHRRPSTIHQSVDTTSLGSCGTVTIHARATSMTFLGDMMQARSPSDAQALGFDTLLHAIASSTLPAHLSLPGSVSHLRAALLANLTRSAADDAAAKEDLHLPPTIVPLTASSESTAADNKAQSASSDKPQFFAMVAAPVPTVTEVAASQPAVPAVPAVKKVRQWWEEEEDEEAVSLNKDLAAAAEQAAAALAKLSESEQALAQLQVHLMPAVIVPVPVIESVSSEQTIETKEFVSELSVLPTLPQSITTEGQLAMGVSAHRAWQVVWSLYQRRVLHALTAPLILANSAQFRKGTSTVVTLVAEIHLELSRALHSSEFVNACLRFAYREPTPPESSFGFSPLHVFDYLHALLRTDDIAFCNSHLVSRIASEASKFIGRIVQLLLDDSVPLFHRAYALLPILSFCFSYGGHIELPTPAIYSDPTASQPLPATIADLQRDSTGLSAPSSSEQLAAILGNQVSEPARRQTVVDVARELIGGNSALQQTILSVFQDAQCAPHATSFWPAVLAILGDAVVMSACSAEMKSALCAFTQNYSPAPCPLVPLILSQFALRRLPVRLLWASCTLPAESTPSRLSLRNIEWTGAEQSLAASALQKHALITTPPQCFSNVDVGLQIADVDSRFIVTHIVVSLPTEGSMRTHRLRAIAVYVSDRSFQDEGELRSQNSKNFDAFCSRAKASVGDTRPVLVTDLGDRDYVELALPVPALAEHITLKLNPGGLFLSAQQIAIRCVAVFGHAEGDSPSMPSTELEQCLELTWLNSEVMEKQMGTVQQQSRGTFWAEPFFSSAHAHSLSVVMSESAATCGSCGMAVTAKKFCNHCGSPLTPAPSHAAPHVPVSSAPPMPTKLPPPPPPARKAPPAPTRELPDPVALQAAALALQTRTASLESKCDEMAAELCNIELALARRLDRESSRLAEEHASRIADEQLRFDMSRAKQQCSAAEARLRIEQRLLDLTLQELCCVQAMIGGDASLELPAELSKVRADIRRERHNSTMLTEMTTQRTRTEAEQRALFVVRAQIENTKAVNAKNMRQELHDELQRAKVEMADLMASDPTAAAIELSYAESGLRAQFEADLSKLNGILERRSASEAVKAAADIAETTQKFNKRLNKLEALSQRARAQVNESAQPSEELLVAAERAEQEFETMFAVADARATVISEFGEFAEVLKSSADQFQIALDAVRETGVQRYSTLVRSIETIQSMIVQQLSASKSWTPDSCAVFDIELSRLLALLPDERSRVDEQTTMEQIQWNSVSDASVESNRREQVQALIDSELQRSRKVHTKADRVAQSRADEELNLKLAEHRLASTRRHKEFLDRKEDPALMLRFYQSEYDGMFQQAVDLQTLFHTKLSERREEIAHQTRKSLKIEFRRAYENELKRSAQNQRALVEQAVAAERERLVEEHQKAIRTLKRQLASLQTSYDQQADELDQAQQRSLPTTQPVTKAGPATGPPLAAGSKGPPLPASNGPPIAITSAGPPAVAISSGPPTSVMSPVAAASSSTPLTSAIAGGVSLRKTEIQVKDVDLEDDAQSKLLVAVRMGIKLKSAAERKLADKAPSNPKRHSTNQNASMLSMINLAQMAAERSKKLMTGLQARRQALSDDDDSDNEFDF